MRPLAGIADPRKPGFSVEECARRLRRFAHLEQRLTVDLAGHLPGTPEWEAKHALGRHLWEDAEHATWLRGRVVQLRTSAKLLDRVPDPALAALMDEAREARDTVELLAGYYGVLKTELLAAYRRHLDETQPLADFPTVRLIGMIVAEEEEQLAWAAEALAELTAKAEGRARAEAWQAHLRACLVAAGGIVGDAPRSTPEPARCRARTPQELPKTPVRDARFGVCAEFYDASQGPPTSRPEIYLHTARVRLNEMAAVENIAATLYETHGMPWEYYHDLARHLWDEVRHSCMGQVLIEDSGRRIDEYPLRMGIADFYTLLTPMERYTLLGIGIESDQMRYPPGKRSEFEWFRDIWQQPLGANLQDFDWADEVLHAQIARRWVGAQMGNNRRAMDDEGARLKKLMAATKSHWSPTDRYAQLVGPDRVAAREGAGREEWEARVSHD